MIGAMVLCASTVLAHEHWIDADAFYPDTCQTITVHLCSGHYYPKSSFALQDKVLESVSWQRPDGTSTSVQTITDAKQRTGTLAVETTGIHVLRFTLKRPRAQAPSYEGKVILVVGDQDDRTNRYASDEGLELVPEQSVSTLQPGDTVAISLWMDGRRVAGSISASAEGGKTALLTTGMDRPAVLKLRKADRYLVTSSYRGRGASLVFKVRNGK